MASLSIAKLYRLILLVFFLCTISIQTFSQKLNTTVELPKGKWSLEEILTYLSQHYPVQFSYVKENIATTNSIIIPTKLIRLNELLVEIFKQADLEYQLLSNQFVLRKNRNSFPKASNEIILTDIEGTITDSLTHLPLPYASVYLNHTTIGTATDENGKFIMKNVPVDKYEFIFSYVGYKTMIYPLMLKPDRHPQLVVKLLPIVKELQKVFITPPRNKAWQKNYEQFRRELLGGTTNSRLCTILNPQSINLTKDDNGLIAETIEPLEIENRALGYKIFLTIKKFVIDSEKGGYSLEFYSRFDSLPPTNNAERLRWEVNRMNSYAGSEMHLFRSILDHRSWSEGFSIYKQNGNSVLKMLGGNVVTPTNTIPFEDKLIIVDTSDNNLAVVFENGKYLITYEKQLLSQSQQTIKGATHATSIIDVNSATLKVDSRGAPVMPYDYIRKGFINTHRIADKLPADFDPEKSRRKIASFHLHQSGFIEGIVLDSITHQPISGAEVFINFSTSHTKTNKQGQFKLNEIGLGINEVVISAFKYVPTHYKILSDSIHHPMNTFTLSEKSFHQLNVKKLFNQPVYDPGDIDRAVEISGFRRNLFFYQTILNERLLEIRIDEVGNKYYDSYFPLEIIDKKMGYLIKVFLEKAHMSKRMGDNILPPKASCYFETIDTLFKNQHIELARLEAYEGSFSNFSMALFTGRTIEEGFSIFKNSALSFHSKKLQEKERKEIFPSDLSYSKSSDGTSVELPDWIEVHHLLPPFTTTRIFKLHIPARRILFNDFGNSINDSTDISPSDKKLIPKLPIDYRPPKTYVN